MLAMFQRGASTEGLYQGDSPYADRADVTQALARYARLDAASPLSGAGLSPASDAPASGDAQRQRPRVKRRERERRKGRGREGGRGLDAASLDPLSGAGSEALASGNRFRVTSLIRIKPLLGPYSRTMSKAIWWP